MKPSSCKMTLPKAIRRMLCGWMVLLTMTLASAKLAADDAATAFDAANKLYEQGRFPEAVAAYENLLQESGTSPALHFNLGNAHFKSGSTGMAIWHYRVAERMAPRDPDIHANLRFARDSIGSAGMGSWQNAMLSRMTLNEWSVLAGVSLWIWLGLLGWRLARPSMQSSLRTAARWALTGFLITGSCLAATTYERFIRKEAVVTATEAVVRFGPLEESESHFTLRNGAEVQLLDSKDGWWQVMDAQNRSGWIKSSQALPLP